MEKKLISQDKNVKRFLITFEQKELLKAEKDLAVEFNKSHSFEGFRKGKVPVNVIKMRLGEDFKNWIKDYLTDLAYEELNKEQIFIFEPTLESFANDDEKCEIEILGHAYPEVKSTRFEEMTVEIPATKQIVTNFVESKIKDILSENAILDPKEEPAEYDDFARLFYTVTTPEGKVLYDNKEIEHVLYDHDKRELVQDVIGKKSGETFEFDKEEKEKGTTYKYSVKIDQIYKRTLPELTDEIAKETEYEVENVEQLKAKLEENALEMFGKWNEDYIKNYIVGEMPDYVETDISEDTITHYKNFYIENLKSQNKYEEELKKHDDNEEKFDEEITKSAIKYINELTIVEKIAEENAIKPEKEDIDQAIASISNMYQMPFERVKESVYSNEKMLNEVVWDVLKAKVAQHIKEKVQIKEVERDTKENTENTPE